MNKYKLVVKENQSKR